MSLVDLIARVRTGLIQVVIERNGERAGSGSAFLIQGGILTNSHVIRPPNVDAIAFRPADTDADDPASYIRLLPDACQRAIAAESPESDRDYAFLRLDEPELLSKYRFSLQPDPPPRPGEKVVFLGFPFGMQQLTAHVGYVSSIFEKGGTEIIQIDGSINGGNSGGPLLRLDGTVVGIVTRAVTGLIDEQFARLMQSFRANRQALQGVQGVMSIGPIDPIQALGASQAAMEQIARDLHRSANVGIGYAYSVKYASAHVAQLG